MQQDEKLEDFEEFLNVMGIHCKLILKTLPDGEVKLYFKHKTLVPFIETASSGTISLMNLYRRFFSRKKNPAFYLWMNSMRSSIMKWQKMSFVF